MKRVGIALLLVLASMSSLVGLAKAVFNTPTTAATTFYDGRLGTLPAAQGLLYATLVDGPTQELTTGGVIFDTLVLPFGQAHQAGYVADPNLLPRLDRTTGYTVTMAVQILNETHLNNDRAGFSLLALSDDAGGSETVKGLELAFWENEIWAQNDDTQGGYFTHGEGVAFDTASSVITYSLHIITDTYTLSASGLPILSGPIRDYTGFIGTIDPYETPNALGIGDNTTSAGAEIQLNYLAVTTAYTAPEERVYLPLVVRP